MSIAVDSTGNVYVGDNRRLRIITQTPEGSVVTTLAGSGEAGHTDGTGVKATFNGTHGMAVDGSGNIYMGDAGNNLLLIRKITPTPEGGVVTTLAGSTRGYADGTGAEAKFRDRLGVAVDSAGNVYVADSGNNLIRKITPTPEGGVVTTFAGSGEKGYADGTAQEAQFNSPYDVALDSAGNVYVADTGNYRIRKITPTPQGGVVTTLAGSGDWGNGWGKGGYADGIGTEAQFNNPVSVAVDSTGNVYVLDTNNHRIRKITPVPAP
ncbi:MAG: hypothetical protein LBT00_08190 [Spirochaetaceae bacterium]|nr:hypothetical protein [Spirochaetaceae bacterium]